ncbi:MAG TPA: hypothetical protein VEB86_09565 [Chryseosolibacter sp.]|nr:hypothetical protein [Chryseosolibacter sp.]
MYLIELFVIALSIFTGLQVDNWNKYNQDRELELIYLTRIYRDLSSDTAYYTDRITRTKTLLDAYRNFIVRAYGNTRNLDEFLTIMRRIDFPAEQLITQNSTYFELINEGNLNLITDDSLKWQIVELHRQIEVARNHFAEYNQFTANLLMHANTKLNLIKYLVMHESMLPWDDHATYRDDEWNFINDRKSERFRVMENLIAMYYHKHGLFIAYMEDLKEKTICLLKAIKTRKNSLNK